MLLLIGCCSCLFVVVYFRFDFCWVCFACCLWFGCSLLLVFGYVGWFGWLVDCVYYAIDGG